MTADQFDLIACYATEKIIKTPILQNKVSANDEGKTTGKNRRVKISIRYKINLKFKNFKHLFSNKPLGLNQNNN